MKTGTHDFIEEFWQAARQGPRLYFAPLVGAIRAVREELSACGLARFVHASVEVSHASPRKRKR